jgi:hypothetical protein
MALKWDVSKNENAFREVVKEEYDNYLENNKHTILEKPTSEIDGKYYIMNTHCFQLIWLCGLSIGLPEINETNYEKVFNRIVIHERLFGTSMHQINTKTKKAEQLPFTLEMVKMNIGLWTNGTWLTSEQWKNQLMKRIVENAKV